MRTITAIIALCAISVPACVDSATQQRNAPTGKVAPPPSRYCVVSLVEASDPYFAAVEELRRVHADAMLVSADVSLDGLGDRLRESNPDYVAIVVRPESFDVNLVRRIMWLATEVDDDPFLDFAYGFITGDSPDSAVALVKAGQVSADQRKPAISMIGVMEGSGFLAKSSSSTQQLPLRRGSITQNAHMVVSKGEDAHRDTGFIETVMPQLEASPILLFAGHGYPREVVGGPTYEHLQGRNFQGAVALNIACYTGVTGKWYEDDWRAMKVSQRDVPPEESFCLNMLNTGVAGYVAYACPRPSGPTMLGDAITAAIAGQRLGELRRVDGNSVVLAHLQQGFDALQIKEEVDGTPINRQRKVQDLLLEMSTGGVLFGDPACQPFTSMEGTSLRRVSVSRADEKLQARVEIAGPLWHFFGTDQLVMWDSTTPSVRLEARIALNDAYASDVRLTESSFGDAPYQLVAAGETHQGERFLHVKASFKTPGMPQLVKLGNQIHGTFEVTTSATPVENKVIRHGSLGQ